MQRAVERTQSGRSAGSGGELRADRRPSRARAPDRGAGLVEVLAERAATSPGATAYEFVDADGEIEALSYGVLAERASALAGSILAQQDQERVRPALLLYPPGLEYVIAVHACLLAGVPAVPAYPPEPWRPDAGLGRLSRIADDLGPAIVLADELVSSGLEMLGASHLRPTALAEAPPLDLDAAARPDPDDVALVQYTSGSTSAPRGVVVRHRNLEHNMGAIAAYFGLDAQTRGLIWLPPYHDMGLIGGILTPLYFGFPVRLLSPLDFLKRPLSWLHQISDFRATISGGPNFAYDLCVRRRVSEEEVAQLDLSGWRLAFNGAEPVRRRTMEAFAAKFAPAGFRRSSFFPCYGLAEATLIVSGAHWDGEAADEEGRVACGLPLPDQELRVVDPATGRPVADDTEGELWLSGPSVTDGYWSAAASEELFGELEGRRFLRTGDLGYLRDGELVLSGRV
ncbi:MAG TPA: AMP-binding protein, partial [Gaiellaceae bacterium]